MLVPPLPLKVSSPPNMRSLPSPPRSVVGKVKAVASMTLLPKPPVSAAAAMPTSVPVPNGKETSRS